MTKGDKVRFDGCSKEQQAWGSNDNSNELTIGEVYILSDVEEHNWHTKVSVEGIDGQFNSVCFSEI